jgi:nucleotide-binding universal stress UspA family protein
MSGQQGRVVVGVDGSEASFSALRWAARFAEQRNAELEVLTAWDYPSEPTPFGIVPSLASDVDELARPREHLEAAITDVLGADALANCRVTVVKGRPEAMLLLAARDADALVVGTRGRNPLTGLLLGSVSEHCIRHSRCPVVVVPSPAVE